MRKVGVEAFDVNVTLASLGPSLSRHEITSQILLIKWMELVMASHPETHFFCSFLCGLETFLFVKFQTRLPTACNASGYFRKNNNDFEYRMPRKINFWFFFAEGSVSVDLISLFFSICFKFHDFYSTIFFFRAPLLPFLNGTNWKPCLRFEEIFLSYFAASPFHLSAVDWINLLCIPDLDTQLHKSTLERRMSERILRKTSFNFSTRRSTSKSQNERKVIYFHFQVVYLTFDN